MALAVLLVYEVKYDRNESREGKTFSSRFILYKRVVS